METRNEDTIVRQIEKNLSNHISDNLFLAGREVEANRMPIDNNIPVRSSGTCRQEISNDRNPEEAGQEIPLVSNDYISSYTGISRAEYIRQARESCLRQLSNTQIYSRPYDVNYMDNETELMDQPNGRKAKVTKLFHEDSESSNSYTGENNVQELASYRSLIIRGIVAILLFLSIFAFDKFNLTAGVLNNQMIQEYVTGNDALQDLEDILVTWLN